MEILRIIAGAISFGSFINFIYFFIGQKHFFYTFKNKEKLITIFMYSQVVFAIIATILSNIVYDKQDFTLMGLAAFSAVYYILIKIYKKPNSKKEIFLKAGTYEIISLTDVSFAYSEVLYFVKNILKANVENEEKYFVFYSLPPREDCDIFVNYTPDKVYSDILYVESFVHSKKTFIEVIDFLLILYIMTITTYGFVAGSTLGLKFGYPLESGSPFDYFTMGIAYFLSHFCCLMTRYGKDYFTKFVHYISLIFYIIVLIECILMWFY